MKVRLMMILLLCALGFGLALMVVSKPADTRQDQEATPIQVGIMSAKQREHSKLYGNYKTNRKLDNLPVADNNDKNLEQGVYIEPGTPVVASDAPVVGFEDFLKEMACGADAIVIGEVNDKQSQLNENREFLFTDYTMTVQEVFKDNAQAPFATGASMTVSRPGGRVQINGRVVSAIDSSFKLLKKGKHYLLFLKYLPGLDIYQSIRKGSFLLEDDELTLLTEEFVPGGGSDTRPFTKGVRHALQSGCPK